MNDVMLVIAGYDPTAKAAKYGKSLSRCIITFSLCNADQWKNNNVFLFCAVSVQYLFSLSWIKIFTMAQQIILYLELCSYLPAGMPSGAGIGGEGVPAPIATPRPGVGVGGGVGGTAIERTDVPVGTGIPIAGKPGK